MAAPQVHALNTRKAACLKSKASIVGIKYWSNTESCEDISQDISHVYQTHGMSRSSQLVNRSAKLDLVPMLFDHFPVMWLDIFVRLP